MLHREPARKTPVLKKKPGWRGEECIQPGFFFEAGFLVQEHYLQHDPDYYKKNRF
jgi:hypothetical protein